MKKTICKKIMVGVLITMLVASPSAFRGTTTMSIDPPFSIY